MADRIIDGITMVPLVCADCTIKMAGSSDQVVYQCDKCRSSFMLRQGTLQPVPVIHYAGTGEIRLPFWEVSCAIQSSCGTVADLKTMAAWCGITRQIGEEENRSPSLLVPAGAMTPPNRVRLGKNLFVRMHRFHQVPDHATYRFEPAVLADSDCEPLAEMIILSSLAEVRRSDPDFLHSFRLQLGIPHLVTIPFARSGNRLLQTELTLEVSS